MITDLQIGGYFMKKCLSVILFTVMLYMILLCTSASANSWGLTGKLYQSDRRPFGRYSPAIDLLAGCKLKKVAAAKYLQQPHEIFMRILFHQDVNFQ